jgi:hypothetical protein
MTDILQTSIGPAVVLHRLALAVECRDALSDRPVDSPIMVSYRRLPTPTNPNPAWRGFSRTGLAQFTLRHRIPDNPTRPLPQLQIKIEDPSRRYVPRRFTVTPWTYAQVKEPAAYVPTHARLLRLWLRPGSAYQLPQTATVMRGRVALQNSKPVRWARVEGTTPFSVAGWAHADERGEFVLPILDPGYDPVRDPRLSVVVTLSVVAAKNPPASTPKDRTADLVSEIIQRSSNPPLDTELDNDVLRGAAVPPGYVGNIAPARQVTVRIGAAVNLTQDVEYLPTP